MKNKIQKEKIKTESTINDLDKSTVSLENISYTYRKELQIYEIIIHIYF